MSWKDNTGETYGSCLDDKGKGAEDKHTEGLSQSILKFRVLFATGPPLSPESFHRFHYGIRPIPNREPRIVGEIIDFGDYINSTRL